ncbi:DUF397 domain-containing protein [Streptomyces inhibens]|uniref:DUF397 domain-containing protein n=1 Tax=Streptomyces inhibens TaxID=2293571 RepID=UPI00378B7BF7
MDVHELGHRAHPPGCRRLRPLFHAASARAVRIHGQREGRRRRGVKMTAGGAEPLKGARTVALRDSKTPDRPPLRFAAGEWSAFRRGIQAGELHG